MKQKKWTEFAKNDVDKAPDAAFAVAVAADLPLDDLKDQDEVKLFHDLIRDSRPHGYDSIGGEASELPVLPGLYVENYGDVILPLDKENGERLVKVCKQAPYGLKYETLVDRNVRDTFQLDPKSIKINNNRWESNLEIYSSNEWQLDLVVIESLRLNCTKCCFIRKEVILRSTQIPKKRKTCLLHLLFNLPSIYEGGELVIHNTDSTETVYDFGQTDRTGTVCMIHFAAHYADVEHEVARSEKWIPIGPGIFIMLA